MHYNKRCPCTPSDFTRFWVNSLVWINEDKLESSEFISLVMGISESHPHFVIVMPTTTPHSTIGSNKLNDLAIAPDLAQYFHNRVWQHL
jgi:hypothetical protein